MTDVVSETTRASGKPRGSGYVARILAALLAASLAFAACSSEDDPSETTTDPVPDVTPTPDDDVVEEGTTSTTSIAATTAPVRAASFRGVTADTIKVGFVDVDFERMRTELGIDVGSPDTGLIMEALIADLNERGGINGRSVDVVVEQFLPADGPRIDEICLQLVEDEEVFAVLGGFGGPGSEEGNGCIAGTGETILVGGLLTEERLAQATAPWISPDMNASRRGAAFVNALVESGELEDLGVLSVHAVLQDQDEAADVIHDALVAAGATVALRSTGEAGADQIAAASETELMLERARLESVESIVVVGTSPTVTDAIFAADGFTVVIPNTEEVANLEHATFGEGDRMVGAGSIAQLDDPALSACIELAAEAVGSDAVPADANDGDLSFWTSTLRACRNFALFEAVATEAGVDLSNDSFAAALATVDLPPLPVFPFASLGPDKPDARDTLSILEWDAATGGFVEAAGPFNVAK